VRRPLTMLSAAVLATGLATVALAGQNADRAAAAASPACSTLRIPVALASGTPVSDAISALYCTPARATGTLAVLVPGATYNLSYFDWPQVPGLYNFTDKELRAGRAVLDIDRLGSGASSHPESTLITGTVSAYALHQVITYARATLGYGRVDLIGHSLGSVIAAIDAGTWPGDVNALVLTGYLDLTAPTADTEQALNDIAPAGHGLDSGYVTTDPGDRATLFYYPPSADPAVVAYDEAHKDVVSETELETGLATTIGSPGIAPAARITAPVLIMVGQEDFLYCEGSGAPDCADQAALAAQEQPYFPAAASLTVETVADTGHDLQLSTSAGISDSMILAWEAAH
jgi:pimeloyl-ACP methyl ester carboxylesterase